MGSAQLSTLPTIDAYVSRTDLTPSYPPAGATSYASVDTTITAERRPVSGEYRVSSMLLRFDTSVIPDGATIYRAWLQLYPSTLASVDGLSLVASWGALNFTTADYSLAPPSTNAHAGTLITALTLNQYNSLELTGSEGFPEISKTATTDVRVDVTQRGSDATPTGNNVVAAQSNENAGGFSPRLVVQHSSNSLDLASSVKHTIGAGSLSSEGQEGYDSIRELMRFYDGVRERVSSEAGFMPYAYPIGGGPLQTPTVSSLIANGGGVMAMPIVLEGHMLLQSVTYRDTATATQRGPVEFGLYEDRLNNTNVLDLIPGAVGTLGVYVPNAASNRTINVTSPPVYLAPGCYWLAIKNNHASNNLALGNQAGGTMLANTAQTKLLTTAALGSTLDFVAATWTKITALPGVRLNGRVFGQASAF